MTRRAARLTLRQASRYHVHATNLFQLLGPDALGGPADYFGDDNYWETVLSIGIDGCGLSDSGAPIAPPAPRLCGH